MSLSDEAVIGLVGLLLMCGPLAALVWRAKFCRRLKTTNNGMPSVSNQVPKLLTPVGLCQTVHSMPLGLLPRQTPFSHPDIESGRLGGIDSVMVSSYRSNQSKSLKVSR
jgi:hypothetical protein